MAAAPLAPFLQRAIQDSEVFQLPSREQLAEEARAPPEQAVIHRRIQDVVGVLMDFNKRREPGVARSAYVNQLTADICNYYGYNQDLVRTATVPVRMKQWVGVAKVCSLSVAGSLAPHRCAGDVVPEPVFAYGGVRVL